MPAWLQQPPAWKRDPVKIPAPARTLPPPDESVIDPRTMLDIDDLPRWLQDLLPDEPAEPPVNDPEEGTGSSTPSIVDDSAFRTGMMSGVVGGVPHEDAIAVATAPPEAAQEADHLPPVEVDGRFLTESSPAIESATNARITGASASDRSTPWWLSDRVLGLVLLGIVLAMIYVVLAVSGII
jgi:hypothetical protein